MHHTLTGIRPTFLHPSSFPPSSFFSRHHFPCSWQTNTNTAISEKLNEKQTLWQQIHPLHTDTPTDTPTHAPTGGHSSMHHTLTGIRPTFLHPSFFHPLPPFPFLLFLKTPLPMLLARRHQHSHFKKV